MPAKDFIITINTDNPVVFDALEEWLEDHGATWDAIMTSKPTGDRWTKHGQPPASSLNEPAVLRLVEPMVVKGYNDDEPPC